MKGEFGPDYKKKGQNHGGQCGIYIWTYGLPVDLELFTLYLHWEHEGNTLIVEGIKKAEAKNSYPVRCSLYIYNQSTCHEVI